MKTNKNNYSIFYLKLQQNSGNINFKLLKKLLKDLQNKVKKDSEMHLVLEPGKPYQQFQL